MKKLLASVLLVAMVGCVTTVPPKGHYEPEYQDVTPEVPLKRAKAVCTMQLGTAPVQLPVPYRAGLLTYLIVEEQQNKLNASLDEQWAACMYLQGWLWVLEGPIK